MAGFRVIPEGLNLRTGPGTDNPSSGELKQGAVVEKLEERHEWYLVAVYVDSHNFKGEITGWVNSDELERTP